MSEACFGFEAYCLYLALRLHFTGNYDFHKYGGKVSAKEDTWWHTHDAWMYKKLANQQKGNVKNFLVTAFAYSGKKAYISEIINHPRYVKLHAEAQARIVDIANVAAKEVAAVGPYPSSLLPKTCSLPPLLMDHFAGKVSLETVAATHLAFPTMFDGWAKHLSSDPLFTDVSFRARKYAPFLGTNGVAVRTALKALLNKSASDKAGTETRTEE